MPKIITVEKGDCFINLCKQAGFFWETVWNHPENQKLREKRKKLNILKKGDRVYMPDRELKKVSKPTEQQHVFLLRGTPVNFSLTLLNLGQPRANEDYLLSIDGDSFRRGRTDETGTLKALISPKAHHGLLLLGEHQEEITINFGHLDPIEEVSGAQTRLRNLGYYYGAINGALDDDTIAAVTEFQRSVKLKGTGEISDETRKKLLEVHGS